MSIEKEVIAGRLFMEAALVDLPLLCQFYPDLQEKFAKRTFTFQVRIADEDYKSSGGFYVNKGVFTLSNNYIENADIEFTFNSLMSFNTYFAGKGTILPKIKGMLKIGLFMDVMAILSKFSSILWQKQPISDSRDKEVQALLLFRILSRSIKIVQSEELVEITHFFGAEQNSVIYQHIDGFAYDLPEIVLKYAPNENTNSQEVVEYRVTYDNLDDAINLVMGNASILSNKFNNEMSPTCVRIIEYFALKAKEYTELAFR